MSLEAFDSIELDDGWVKNQPRVAGECDPDRSRFLKSPDSESLLTKEWYGFSWLHVATLVEDNLPVDDDGLLKPVQLLHCLTRAVVQLVRIPACHAGGLGFESRPLRYFFRALTQPTETLRL